MRTLRMICVVLLGACGAASAHNSMNLVKFHCSTAIMIAGTELPAGDSTIQMLEAGDGSVVLSVRSESGPQAIVLVNRLTGAAPHGSDKVQVTLQRLGNVYRLDQIWLSNREGFQVVHPDIE